MAHLSNLSSKPNGMGRGQKKKALFLDKKCVKMGIFLLQLNNNIRKENRALVLVLLLCYFGFGEIITMVYICQSSIFLFCTTDSRSGCASRSSFALLLPLYAFFLLKYSSLYPP